MGLRESLRALHWRYDEGLVVLVSLKRSLCNGKQLPWLLKLRLPSVQERLEFCDYGRE